MKNKRKALFNKPIVLLAAAAVLLIISTVGTTQAAITYYSEDYVADVDVPNVGVALLENGKEVTTIMGDIKDFTLGETYPEILTAKNTGNSEGYIRVIVKKHWKNAKGEKDVTLSPTYIELGLVEGDWIIDKNATTAERTILYYKKPVAAGAETTQFTKDLRIDEAFETTVKKDTVKTETIDGVTYTNITYTHPFDGYTFNIDVEADVVQTFEGVKAIKSEWGVDVTIGTDGSLTLLNQ